MKYKKRFTPYEISYFENHKIHPKYVNNYDSRFKLGDIKRLLSFKCESEKANLYPKRFNGGEIAVLYHYNITPEQVINYDSRFNGHDIVSLFLADISPYEADRYYEQFSAQEIFILSSLGIKSDYISTEGQKKLYKIIKKITHGVGLQYDNYTFLGTGNQSIVLFNKEKRIAYKFSEDLWREIELLKKLKLNNKTLKNIVEIMNVHESESVYIIELLYIEGSTLEKLCDKDKKIFSKNDLIRYCSNIFNGLLELRTCMIYHRDLWLGNILIDKLRDEAIIIDLGIGTDNPKDSPLHNRRYGGENDLQSLGQIMYKMATGKHIFNSTIDKSTHLISDKIKAERERIYADGSLLETRLKEVDEQIADKTLAEIIKICLTAKGSDNDYGLLGQRFNEYES